MTTFRERAKLLGVSPDTMFRGVITIPTLDRLTEILRGLGPTDGDALFAGIPFPEKPLGKRMSRLVAEHIHCARELTSEERSLIETAFPVDVNLVSGENLTIASEWDLNEEVASGPIVVNLGTLTLDDGAYIIVSNRKLDFTVDRLIRTFDTVVGDCADFNIMGLPGAQGDDQPTPPGAEAPGAGAGGNCSSAGIADSPGSDGDPGTESTKGHDGNPGKPGAPSLETVIRITTELQTPVPITLKTQSGAGGKGGTGGKGSPGQPGAAGGDGATCGCTGSAGGSGGTGGKGGQGGTGGPGCDGKDAEGNIEVRVPVAYIALFAGTAQATWAPPGAGGEPGDGGEPGGAGLGGAGGKYNDGGADGGKGAQGDPGARGPDATVSGKPAEMRITPT